MGGVGEEGKGEGWGVGEEGKGEGWGGLERRVRGRDGGVG